MLQRLIIHSLLKLNDGFSATLRHGWKKIIRHLYHPSKAQGTPKKGGGGVRKNVRAWGRGGILHLPVCSMPSMRETHEDRGRKEGPSSGSYKQRLLLSQSIELLAKCVTWVMCSGDVAFRISHPCWVGLFSDIAAFELSVFL